jgi:hypothetical protein
MVIIIIASDDETAGGLEYVAHVFVFLGSITICHIVQINPFRPSPSHSATESQAF